MNRLAVRHGEWKLVREVRQSDGRATNYLFRIEEDPNERNDLAAKNPEIVKDLVARIEKWQALHPSGGVRPDSGPPAGWKGPPQWAEAASR